MITVFLIDDHPSMRAVLRLRLELEADIAVIGDAGNDVGAAAQVVALVPNVVILDAMMPILDHDRAAALVGAFTSSSAVIVLSLYDDPTTRACAAAAGARAVISKHGTDEQLLAAIRSAAASSFS
jgi:DNA-binding NarL/FixJ family response regulator